MENKPILPFVYLNAITLCLCGERMIKPPREAIATSVQEKKMVISFSIPGIPLARKAHKIIRLPNGRPLPILDPQCESHQNLIKLCAAKAMRGKSPIQGMVELTIWANWPAPKSLKKPQRLTLEMVGSIPYPKRADADNIAKNVLDGLKGIAIADDKLVVYLHVHKRIAPIPGTDIEIREL